jgi:hypothetical protein
MDDTAIEETDRTTVTRSWSMWRGGAKDLDLNPHTSGWPSFSFYLTLAVQVAYKGWYLVVHPATTPAEFADAVERNVAPLFLLARLVGATIGVWLVHPVLHALRAESKPLELWHSCRMVRRSTEVERSGDEAVAERSPAAKPGPMGRLPSVTGRFAVEPDG